MIVSKGRILLVDDEPLVLEIIDSALRKEGYEVVCAPSSQDAIRNLERSEFDALVCDIRLENLDGFDVLSIARKKSPIIGAVLMTGAPVADDAHRAAESNAMYLSKPIGIPELLRNVQKAIEVAGDIVAEAVAA